jgi:hypothetical protein
MKRARKIWRDAIEAVVLRLGEAAPPRVLAWYDEESLARRRRAQAEARRRRGGARTREQYFAEVRAKAATRKAAVPLEERRAADRDRVRERRAAMPLEERRAEWARHQRARRARLRAAQEAVTASHVEAAE